LKEGHGRRDEKFFSYKDDPKKSWANLVGHMVKGK